MPNPADQTDLFAAPAADGEELVIGTVARITFHSEDTGYTVLRVSPEGEERTLAVVGRM
ncbi:MAG: hypothetical protein HKN12_09730, partial [Gemmatimonadetes bacterium]|nr:hypothetical protein [Gemmatimonadota bacterium]